MSRCESGFQAPARFRGEFLQPGDAGYDGARAVFNQRVQGRPAVIARCLGVRDVVAALALAREQNLDICVRGGGHSIGGWSSNDGGLVIDLTLMRQVRIDAEARTAWVGGGTRAGDLLVEADRFGLVAVTGVAAPIGLAGLTTGLGEAYLMPKHGYGADHLLAFELVTADGEVLHVTPDEHPDLFWGMRGAGANFGVVTAMQLRLHPAPEHAVGGWIVFDGAHAERLTSRYWDAMERASEHFWLRLVYCLDGARQLQVCMHPGHTGPPELAQREIDAFCEGMPPVADNRRSGSYLDLIFEVPEGEPARNEWEMLRFAFDGDRERQIAALLDQARPNGDRGLTGALFEGDASDDDHDEAAGRGIMLWRSVTPAAPVSPGAAPRLQGITMHLGSSWKDPACDAAELDWIQRTTAALREAGVVEEAGNAINHVSTADVARARRIYGDANYERLAKLKARYDPHNLFRSNFNIPPAVHGG